MSANDNILSTLKTEHHTASHMMTQIEAESNDGKRTTLFGGLKHFLDAHNAAVNETLYQVLKAKTGFAAVVKEFEETQAKMTTRLTTIEKEGMTSGIWRTRMGTLKTDWQAHVRREETALFPRMLQTFNADELDSMQTKFIDAKTLLMPEEE